MHKYNIKCRTYNQKLIFHLGDTIIETPSFPMLQMIPSIHRRSYYDMQCDAEMMQQLINQAITTLKTEYILRTNKLALMTNILTYVSTSSRKVSFSNKCFSHIIPRCFLFYSIDLIFIQNRASLSIQQTNYSGAIKITVRS